MSSTDPVVKVHQHLSAIVDMCTRLEDQAIAKAGDRLMPGGLAMVALASAAPPGEYDELLEYAEHHALAGYRDWPIVEDDDAWEPPLQTLLFWSEAWREEHGYPLPARPTEATEANFLRWAAEWAWDNEPKWDDFAEDMRRAKARLEVLLVEGTRAAFTGAPCLYDECRGARLVRKTVPTRGKNGEKAWRLTDWHCPRCKRSWDERSYTSNVYAAIERTRWEDFDGQRWCTTERAARHVDRPHSTIRSWVARGQVAAVCRTNDERTFVLLDDVVARDRLARERRAAWIAARRAKQTTAM